MQPRFTFTSRCRPIAQIGVGADGIPQPAAALWDDALWDDPDAVWSGSEPYWFDVTCWFVDIDGSCGRQRNTEAFAVGEFEIELNNETGWADPLNADSPNLLTLRPGRQVRYGIDHDEYGVIWIQHGWIDEIDPQYNQVVAADTVILRCIDALGEAGRARFAELDEPIGASELAHERLDRILDMVPWSVERRGGDTSGVQMIASTLGGQVADLLGKVGDSIGGAVFGDTAGAVVLRNSGWQVFAGPNDGVIGNVDGGVCPAEWRRPFDRKAITTRVLLGRDDGGDTEQRQYDDEPAQVLYGVETLSRLDLWTQSNTDLDTLAEWLLRVRSAATMPRLSGVKLDAAHGDDVIDLMARVDIFKPSRYRCVYELGRGRLFDAEHFATGWRLAMTPERWELDLSLDTAEPFAVVGASSLWDDNDGWDHTLWAA